jgi:hypothetical protein
MLFRELLEFRHFVLQLMNPGSANRNQIGQSPKQEIALGAEPFELAFARDSLVAQDLQNVSDLLKYLPS